MKRLLATTAVLAVAFAGAALAQTPVAVPNPSAGAVAPSASITAPGAVIQAQNALQSLALYDGPIDGYIGPRTKAALARFQGSAGLPQTAVLDQATMDRLAMATASGSSEPRSATSPLEGTSSPQSPSNFSHLGDVAADPTHDPGHDTGKQ